MRMNCMRRRRIHGNKIVSFPGSKQSERRVNVTLPSAISDLSISTKPTRSEDGIELR